jgi:hypothetical protein
MASTHGGRRLGAGRPSGSRDVATTEQRATLSELARSYTEVAIQTLVEVATKSSSDSARIAAACALLDRAYGRPAQTVIAEEAAGDPLGDLIAEINRRGSTAPIASYDGRHESSC